MPELEKIIPLVKSVGTSQFVNTYFDFVNHILSVEQCVVFEFLKNSPPRNIFAIGRTKKSTREARSLAEDYSSGDYTSGPEFKTIEGDAGSDPKIHTLEDIEFDDPGYYSKYYAMISDELIVVFGDSERLIYCSFFRWSGQPKFTNKEKEDLYKYSDILSFFVNRHVEMQPDAFSGNRLLRDVRYHHVFDLLYKLKITNREAEICTLTVLGYTTVGIGLKLGITPNTVSTHRKRAYAKLGISSQNELFEICIDSVFERARDAK